MAREQTISCTVADVASPARNALVGGPFGSDLVSKDYVSSGVPVIRGTNMGHGRWVDGEFAFVAPAKADSLSANCARPGDLIFTQRGTLGQVALVPSNGFDRYLISQSQMKLTVDKAKADALFLYYVFTSAEQQEYIRQNAIQTGVPHTNLGILRNTPLTLPTLAEQKAIAAVLGALDDNIELNQRMNATLEAMARTLFQSWFVDFDPVRAKLDGRPPVGLDPATAALFPDSFQDSPLGHIPTDWNVSTIGAKLTTVLGGTPSRAKPEYWTDGTVAWINSGKTNEFRIIEPSEWITSEALANSSTKRLPCRTTVLAITGATLGQVSITEIECCANQSVVAILASKEFPTEFIYPWIEENIEKLIASQTGGAQQHINKGNVDELVLLCPDKRVVGEYLSKVKPLFDGIAANCFQSRTLATLRDTLLPKLLNGEISIPTVE